MCRPQLYQYGIAHITTLAISHSIDHDFSSLASYGTPLHHSDHINATSSAVCLCIDHHMSSLSILRSPVAVCLEIDQRFRSLPRYRSQFYVFWQCLEQPA
ncbi:hypothetical protein ElyMa_001441200 [Elysia marginata]|uniref:Uncharacterized protein n=1 Tax=Elysia marginata TaxID=1093978 RepID=A0AAV4IZG8_9GAST|nr:hypothetical protein ElyMa_001441200 [Elysia marginata]